MTVSCGHRMRPPQRRGRVRPRCEDGDAHLQRDASVAAREPGLAGAALVTGDVAAGDPRRRALADDTARLVWQAAGGRVALVTDAIAAARAGDGAYTLAESTPEVEDGVARAQIRCSPAARVHDHAVRNLVAPGAGRRGACCGDIGSGADRWWPELARSRRSAADIVVSTTRSRSCACSARSRRSRLVGVEAGRIGEIPPSAQKRRPHGQEVRFHGAEWRRCRKASSEQGCSCRSATAASSTRSKRPAPSPSTWRVLQSGSSELRELRHARRRVWLRRLRTRSSERPKLQPQRRP